MRYGRIKSIKEQLIEDGIRYFVPDMIRSLLFIQAERGYMLRFEQDHFERMWVYRDRLTRELSVIRDKEMEVFMFVCTAGKQGLILLGDDKPEYHMGDKVRVTEGPFKGAEGYIKRIKKDRRLVVSINGVVAVATAYIHPQFLEAI